MRWPLWAVTFFLVLLGAGGAKGDDADRTFQLLMETGSDFSEFARAAATNLDSVDIPGQYTLFAPTNTAFEAKMACFNSPKVGQKYKQNVLKYHFINVSLTEEAIVALVGNTESLTWKPVTFYNHQQLNITLTNSTSVAINQVSNIVKPNAVLTAQATVHGIDNVLIPPDLQASTTYCMGSSPPSLLKGLRITLLFLLVSFFSAASDIIC